MRSVIFSGVTRCAVDLEDPVARLEADRVRRAVLEHLLHRRRGLAACGHEDHGEDDDGEGEVRRRACADRHEALPDRLLPVRVLGEAVAEVLETAVDAGRRAALLHGCLEGVELDPRLLPILGGESSLQALGRADELGRIVDGAAEERVDVGRLRPSHAGDGHVAPEGDRTERVVDVVPPHLRERRPEADRETPRAHADRQGAVEVAQLVNDDEQGQAQDGDQDAHARVKTPWAKARA